MSFNFSSDDINRFSYLSIFIKVNLGALSCLSILMPPYINAIQPKDSKDHKKVYRRSFLYSHITETIFRSMDLCFTSKALDINIFIL